MMWCQEGPARAGLRGWGASVLSFCRSRLGTDPPFTGEKTCSGWIKGEKEVWRGGTPRVSAFGCWEEDLPQRGGVSHVFPAPPTPTALFAPVFFVPQV